MSSPRPRLRSGPGSYPEASARGGFLMPVVLVMLAVILLLALSRFFVSHQQLDVVVRMTDRERAYQLAASGLRVGMRQLDGLLEFLNDPDPATYPKRDRAPAELAGLAGRLLDADGRFLTERAELPVDSAFLPYLKDMPDVKELEVSLVSSECRPLFLRPPGGGLLPDPRETLQILTLWASSEVGSSRALAVAYKESRVVDITLPVLGKFALFLRGQGSLEVNGVKDSSALERMDNRPVVVRPGREAEVRTLAVAEAASLLERQGWIYLGGERPWSLTLGAGGGVAANRAAMLLDGVYEYELGEGGPLAASGQLRYYATQSPVYPELAKPEQREALRLAEPGLLERTSLLELTGSSEAPSPTLVCGPVNRRWALLQGLSNTASGARAPLPMLDEGRFEAGQWPGGVSASTAQAIREQFGGQFERYAARMSQFVEEPFNLGNLALLASQSQPLLRTMLLDPAVIPAPAPRMPPSARLAVDGRPVRFHEAVTGGGYSLTDDAGRALTDRLDLEAFKELGFLVHKAGRHFRDGAAFLEGCRGGAPGGLKLGGVVHVAGSLALERPLRVERGGGGMVLVDGDLRLAERLTSESLEPVTLVSLNGNIRVDTAAPVDAALAALAGRIELGPAFDLRGALAAGELTVARATEAGPRQLAYNEAFDPTASGAHSRNYRVMTWKRWRQFVP